MCSARKHQTLVLLCMINFAGFEMRGRYFSLNSERNPSCVPFIGSNHRYEGHDTFLHTEFNAVCCRKVQKKLEGFSFGFSFLCVACSNGALFILLRNRWRTPHGCIIKFPQRKQRTLRQTPSGISLSSGDVALLPGTLTSSFSSSSSSISRCCASPPLWFYGKKFSWFPRIHLS